MGEEHGQLAFERRIAEGTDADPLQTWCDYVRWASDDCQAVGKEVLQRACVALAANPCHHADIRLLRLWVRHADNAADSEQVLEYVHEIGIGLQHALLYEAWAAVCEKKRRFDKVEAIYILYIYIYMSKVSPAMLFRRTG